MKPNSYQTKLSVMNQSEVALFEEIKKHIPFNYYVFPNMRIADFIQATDGSGFYFRRNKILPKHVDFLICDSHFKPILAIELNGSSHYKENRIKRDNLVNEIFKNANLRLETIHVGENFCVDVKTIFDSLKITS